jgi:hypothetical protein
MPSERVTVVLVVGVGGGVFETTTLMLPVAVLELSVVLAVTGIMYSFSDAEGLTLTVIGTSHGILVQLAAPANDTVI